MPGENKPAPGTSAPEGEEQVAGAAAGIGDSSGVLVGSRASLRGCCNPVRVKTAGNRGHLLDLRALAPPHWARRTAISWRRGQSRLSGHCEQAPPAALPHWRNARAAGRLPNSVVNLTSDFGESLADPKLLLSCAAITLKKRHILHRKSLSPRRHRTSWGFTHTIHRLLVTR